MKYLSKKNVIIFFFLFLMPIILFSLDYFNIFSKLFPNYSNLSREYDWLSFIGTYVGTIVSAISLIVITKEDRDENTAILRTSQRPYLDISYMQIKNNFFEDNNKKIVFNHGNSMDNSLKQEEYLTLCIKNTGASVAIIDTNKTKVKLHYKVNEKNKEEDVKLDFAINRLSIISGGEIYIKFTKNELYQNGKLLNSSKILGSSVYYKDLFNKNYYDECELKDTLIVLHDNEEIK